MIPAGALYSTEWKSNYTEEKTFLLMPILNKTEDTPTRKISDFIKRDIHEADGMITPMTEISSYNTSYGKTKGYKQIKGLSLPNEIELNKDFMKLAGFYLAEGCITFQKRGGMITFSFGKHEQKYANEVKKLLHNIFSVEAKIREKETALSVEVYSDILAQFFETLFSKGALNKKIPLWMLYLPIEKQKHLIEGYFRGDGHRAKPSDTIRKDGRKRTNKYNSLTFTTISKNLAFSVRMILLRMGLVSSLDIRNNTKSIINGRTIKSKNKIYTVCVNGKSAETLAAMMNYTPYIRTTAMSHYAGIDNNYLYLPIKKIEREQYDGLVMNIGTRSHTYTVNGICVSNCSSDHFSTTSGALAEALRFARKEGVLHPEVQSRLGIASDELNIMERIDLSAEKTANMKGKEKQIALDALNASRDLRHKIKGIKTPDDLEIAAADAANFRTYFMKNVFNMAMQDGTVDKLCHNFTGEEKERCISTITDILEKKQQGV